MRGLAALAAGFFLATASAEDGQIVAIAATGNVRLNAPRPAADPGIRTTPEISRRKRRGEP
jgi:hypothetical protein